MIKNYIQLDNTNRVTNMLQINIELNSPFILVDFYDENVLNKYYIDGKFYDRTYRKVNELTGEILDQDDYTEVIWNPTKAEQ